MNTRLYPRPAHPVNDLAGTFAKVLRDAPDLADLSDAAVRVLATAGALFYERGAVATSVRDITRACGLTPGAMYNHFASKDDLLHTLVVHGHESLERRVEAALAGCGPAPAERFRAFVEAYLTAHLVHPTLAQVVRREYLHLTPRRYEQIVARRRATRDRLSAILRAGARSKVFTLIGGADGATGQATMVLDMCSRTSEWFDPHRATDVHVLTERYVTAALRLVGAVGAVGAHE